MGAKKFFYILLVTFVVIASFAAALLPQAISPQPAQATTITVVFNSPGTTTWTAPAGITAVTVEVWGGGGKGGMRNSNGGGGGGGGGAYSMKTNIAVTPNNSYTVVVGAGATTTAAGGDSYFINTATVLAKGGNSVADNNASGGSGGAAGSGVGDKKYSGGNGANGVAGSYGGGGGSSAGNTSVGTNASNATGATAPTGGGNGGNGKSAPQGNGVNGLTPGGGGGGGYRTSSGTRTGGNGADGVVIIRYTTYTLTTTTGGNGTVTTPGIGAYTYMNGTVVSIVASPNSCYRFVNWSGSTGTIANLSAASTTITMSNNYSIQANFAISTYTLSVSPNNAGGSPYFDGSGPFNCGANVSIHSNTSPTYIFAGWTPTAGIANASAENTTVTMSQDRVLKANYLSAIPAIGTVSLWTTGASPAETTSITPQSELNIKIPVSENRSFSYLATLKATLYYDADGIYNASEVPVSGNTQTCAILTWTRATNTLTIDSGGSITWSVINSSSVFPSLSSTSGTFEFHFKPGKVATQTTGAARWHIYVNATDSFPYTGNGTQQNLSMNWYGEIVINTASVNWGLVTANLDFADSDPSRETNISMSYICNGAYNVQVKSSTTWTGNSSNALLKPEGNPGPNQFSLKADYDDTLNGSVLVPAIYATFRSGTQTGESGVTESNNSLWLKLGTPFVTGGYNGNIYYKIASP